MWSPETRAWHHSCCGCWRFGWLRIQAAGPTESFYEASKCFQTLIVKPCCWNRCSMWFSTVLLKYAIPSLKTCLLNGTCLSALMVFFQMCNLPTQRGRVQRTCCPRSEHFRLCRHSFLFVAWWTSSHLSPHRVADLQTGLLSTVTDKNYQRLFSLI